MHEVQIGQHSFKGPSSWKELDRFTLQYVAAASLMPDEAGKRYLAQRLFRIPVNKFALLKEFQVLQLYPLLSFLEQQNTLDRWLVFSSKPALTSPAGCLTDLTAEEWVYCEMAYEKWLHSQERQYHNMLMAVLLRPRSLQNGKRPAFNAERLAAQAKKMATLSGVMATSVTLNYAGCRNRIIALHPHIWKQAVQTEDAVTPGIKFTNWTELMLSISPGPFGDYQSTIKTNLWLVLKHMDRQAKHAEEMEARV